MKAPYFFNDFCLLYKNVNKIKEPLAMVEAISEIQKYINI